MDEKGKSLLGHFIRLGKIDNDVDRYPRHREFRNPIIYGINKCVGKHGSNPDSDRETICPQLLFTKKKLKKHNEEQWRLATSKAAVMNVPFGKLISRAGNVIM